MHCIYVHTCIVYTGFDLSFSHNFWKYTVFLLLQRIPFKYTGFVRCCGLFGWYLLSDFFDFIFGFWLAAVRMLIDIGCVIVSVMTDDSEWLAKPNC